MRSDTLPPLFFIIGKGRATGYRAFTKTR